MRLHVFHVSSDSLFLSFTVSRSRVHVAVAGSSRAQTAWRVSRDARATHGARGPAACRVGGCQLGPDLEVAGIHRPHTRRQHVAVRSSHTVSALSRSNTVPIISIIYRLSSPICQINRTSQE